MKNNETIINLLARLNLVFRDISLDEQTANVYASALSDIDIDKLIKSMQNLLENRRKVSFTLPVDWAVRKNITQSSLDAGK